jgi:hypothetical protein
MPGLATLAAGLATIHSSEGAESSDAAAVEAGGTAQRHGDWLRQAAPRIDLRPTPYDSQQDLRGDEVLVKQPAEPVPALDPPRTAGFQRRCRIARRRALP